MTDEIKDKKQEDQLKLSGAVSISETKPEEPVQGKPEQKKVPPGGNKRPRKEVNEPVLSDGVEGVISAMTVDLQRIDGEIQHIKEHRKKFEDELKVLQGHHQEQSRVQYRTVSQQLAETAQLAPSNVLDKIYKMPMVSKGILQLEENISRLEHGIVWCTGRIDELQAQKARLQSEIEEVREDARLKELERLVIDIKNAWQKLQEIYGEFHTLAMLNRSSNRYFMRALTSVDTKYRFDRTEIALIELASRNPNMSLLRVIDQLSRIGGRFGTNIFGDVSEQDRVPTRLHMERRTFDGTLPVEETAGF